jgi:REP element-mobilizing transposase RayT
MKEPAPIRIRSRGYLPHWEREGGTYFLTWRLEDSLPRHVLEQFEFERWEILRRAELAHRDPSEREAKRLAELNRRLDRYLDQGIGSCWLADPRVAAMVQENLLHFHGYRYHLWAWTVMPNHSHAVATPTKGWDLKDILHSWKSYTSHEANKLLSRNGTFWYREYYDHLIRDAAEFHHYVEYTLQNPVVAGLCERWEDWPWSGRHPGCPERF